MGGEEKERIYIFSFLGDYPSFAVFSLVTLLGSLLPAIIFLFIIGLISEKALLTFFPDAVGLGLPLAWKAGPLLTYCMQGWQQGRDKGKTWTGLDQLSKAWERNTLFFCVCLVLLSGRAARIWGFNQHVSLGEEASRVTWPAPRPAHQLRTKLGQMPRAATYVGRFVRRACCNWMASPLDSFG